VLNNESKQLVTFRCPPSLVTAMEAAASSELMSVSDDIRRAILRDLRSRGLFKSEVVAA